MTAYERQKLRIKERYHRLKQEGICVSCGDKPAWREAASECRECLDKRNARHNAWVARNTDLAEAYLERHKNAYRKRTYKLTNEEYDALVKKQNNACAICKVVPKEVLFIDHNHQTGDVRGLLCRNCNTAVGLFRDDPDIIAAATTYLEGDSNDLRRRPKESVAA